MTAGTVWLLVVVSCERERESLKLLFLFLLNENDRTRIASLGTSLLCKVLNLPSSNAFTAPHHNSALSRTKHFPLVNAGLGCLR